MADEQGARNWQSFRVILEGLILGAVLWLAHSISSQSDSLVRLQVQMETLGMQIAGMNQLTQQVAKDGVRLDEHDRRINSLENKVRP